MVDEQTDEQDSAKSDRVRTVYLGARQIKDGELMQPRRRTQHGLGPRGRAYVDRAQTEFL